MLKKGRFFPMIIAGACFSLALAADEGGRLDLPEGITLRPHLYGHFESGQIVKGALMPQNIFYIRGSTGSNYSINHVWTEDAVVEFGFDAIYRDQLKLAFTIGTKLYFSYPQLDQQRFTKNQRQDVYIGDLYAQYHMGDIAMPLFLGQVGFFRFKYNPEGRNFGDYLFRTGTYPIWFDMGFDAPWQRLLGIHAQTNLLQSLKIDLLLVSSTKVPSMNWSLGGVVNYDVGALHFVNIGAGFNFANLFSVYSKDYSYYFGGDPTTPSTDVVSCRYIDPKSGDTAWYTFKGTKVMGRISIDPKVFLPNKEVFGENDLKLYAEADIIGVKSYPDSGISQGGQMQLLAPSYNKLLEKMPVTIGLNVPTFKLLDVLSCEVEWFGARYYNDASNVLNLGNQPLPMNVIYFDDTTQAPKKGYLKWSVYAKKSLFGGRLAITGQIGRDHMTLPCAAYSYEFNNELLVSPKDWAWFLKTSWMF